MNRCSGSSLAMPITESKSPVMPTSLMKAVPPGSTRRSAVGTWVWVPTTRLARPSQKKPIACFSLVASPWKSTMMASAPLAQRTSRELALDRGKRIVERIHEDAAHGVDDENARAVLGLDHRHAAARRSGRIVDRPDQFRRALDEHQRLFLIPGVIAERDRVGAGIEQFAIDRFGDAEAAGRILAIDHHQIELPVADQARQALIDDGAPAATDNVADEKDAHAQLPLRLDHLALG